MNADVQRLEAERLRRAPEIGTLDESFRQLIGLLAALWTMPRDMCAARPDDCPHGPEPHHYRAPQNHRLPCCRQPWEKPGGAPDADGAPGYEWYRELEEAF